MRGAPGTVHTQGFTLHLAAGVIAGEAVHRCAAGIAAGQHHTERAACIVAHQIGTHGQGLVVATNIELTADRIETIPRAIHTHPAPAAVLAGLPVVVAQREHVLRCGEVGQVGAALRAQHRLRIDRRVDWRIDWIDWVDWRVNWRVDRRVDRQPHRP